MNYWQHIFHPFFYSESVMLLLISNVFILKLQWQSTWLSCWWLQLCLLGMFHSCPVLLSVHLKSRPFWQKISAFFWSQISPISLISVSLISDLWDIWSFRPLISQILDFWDFFHLWSLISQIFDLSGLWSCRYLISQIFDISDLWS